VEKGSAPARIDASADGAGNIMRRPVREFTIDQGGSGAALEGFKIH
jgi:hypothetical protein